MNDLKIGAIGKSAKGGDSDRQALLKPDETLATPTMVDGDKGEDPGKEDEHLNIEEEEEGSETEESESDISESEAVK